MKILDEDGVIKLSELIRNALGNKRDVSDSYTKDEVDDLISAANSGVVDDNGEIAQNTAGATESTSKLFLVGAKTQSAAPQTYTRSTAYIGTDGCLYSNSKKVLIDDKSLNATSGHYNIVDGLQMRWGHYTGTITNSGFTITFDEPFSNGCLYADIMSDTASSTNPRGLYSLLSKSATSVRFGVPGIITNNGLFWIAFGY